MKIAAVVSALETLAPPQWAADWDNVGLLIGDAGGEVRKLLLCIDLTESVLAEARAAGAGMVMAYHPVIFKPLTRLTPSAAPVAYAAVRANLAVYCTHTALDAAPEGTHDALADLLGLGDRRPLQAAWRKDQVKIVVFVRPEEASSVADAAFSAGGGQIGDYQRCAFFTHGVGMFYGPPGTHPTVGTIGRQEATEELRLEIVAPRPAAAAVCQAIRGVHSYEQPAIDVYPLEDCPPGVGLGRLGQLDRPTALPALLRRIRGGLHLKRLLVAPAQAGPRRGGSAISTVACCAGSCGSLMQAALKEGAQLYLTGEMRHHDALAAAQAGMNVVCVGHSNSERLVLPHLAGRLRQILPKLQVVLSRQDRDPFEIL